LARINSFLTSLILKTRHSDEEGQTMIEYGLIVALISIVAIAALTLVGSDVDRTFDKVANALT